MSIGLIHGDITKKVIGVAFKVYNKLGFGLVEKVYENSMVVELNRAGIPAKQQEPVKVFYDGCLVGDYVADLVVANKVLIEMKAISKLDPCHEVQLVNYLKATGIPVGLLMNFGHKFEFKRRIFDANRVLQAEDVANEHETSSSLNHPLNPCRSASALSLHPRESASTLPLNLRKSVSASSQD